MPLYYDDKVDSIVIPVCLPWEPNSIGRNLTEESVLTVTGWSRISKDPFQNSLFPHQGSDTLQKSSLTLVSEEKCINQKMYKDGRIQFDFDLQFCAQPQNYRKYAGRVSELQCLVLYCNSMNTTYRKKMYCGR